MPTTPGSTAAGYVDVAIIPHRITLRACHDLDWKVLAYCAPCGVTTMLFTNQSEASRLAALPIGELLERGVLKCSKCGTPTDMLTIDRSMIGVSIAIGVWRVATIENRRHTSMKPS